MAAIDRKGAAYRPPEAVQAFQDGKAKFKAGDFDGSVKAFSDAIEKCPGYLEAYGWRAAGYSKSVDPNGIVQALNDYTRLHKAFQEERKEAIDFD